MKRLTREDYLRTTRTRRAFTTTGTELEPLPYDPRPDCPKCKGSGYLHPWDEENNKPDYSQATPCDAPGCLLESFRGYRGTDYYAGKKGVVLKLTFETFKQRKGVEDAYKEAKSLAEGNANFIWLLLIGGTGSGKTHLLNSIAVVSLRRNIDARLLSVPELFGLLRKAISENRAESYIEEVKNYEMLLLDDFGANLGSDFEVARFEEIIDFRYRAYKPTVLATNLDITSIPERTRSRFLEIGKIVNNTATDFRARKRGE